MTLGLDEGSSAHVVGWQNRHIRKTIKHPRQACKLTFVPRARQQCLPHQSQQKHLPSLDSAFESMNHQRIWMLATEGFQPDIEVGENGFHVLEVFRLIIASFA
jgi:hypothetical protein